jgi:hypothetical protein
MQGFKSPRHAQRFLSAYSLIAQHFRPRRHLLSASAYRQEMRNRFGELGQDHRHGAGCLRSREDRGNVPVCLMTVSASIN